MVMQVLWLSRLSREEAALRRSRCRPAAPAAISVLQYYFGHPPATPQLKYSSTQAFNKVHTTKIAAGPKNSRQGWFAEPEVILVIEGLVEEEALVEARRREG